MNKCEIFFSIDDELTDLDIQEKGWRGDVIVKIGEALFNPTIITLQRLMQEFNDAISQEQVYNIDPNLILVEQTEKRQIIKTLKELFLNGYFNKIKEIDLKKEFTYCKNLQKIENWIQVF